ncbi:MAG: DUF1829 domain-containing protein [Clostridia bacterium]|nr:DUF1829 domain-containing protein [Clostridia bacterium]
MLDASSFIDTYVSWLKQNMTALQLDSGAVEISSPFLDRHNDYIQIYVVKDNNGFILTDDGYTISDLELSGLSFNTPKRKEELQTILRSFGISLDDKGNMFCKCNQSNYPFKKHSLIQAVLAVNDLFVLSQPNIASFFMQDVESFLRDHDVRYTKNIKFTGKSGFDHAYDFVIPQSKASPDRLVKAINNLERTTTQSVIFAWSDTIQTRNPNTKLYTFVNDVEKRVPDTCLDALKEYGIVPVTWSQRENSINELIA